MTPHRRLADAELALAQAINRVKWARLTDRLLSGEQEALPRAVAHMTACQEALQRAKKDAAQFSCKQRYWSVR